MKTQTHLPIYGVGPFYVAGILTLTAAGIAASRLGWLDSGKILILQLLLFFLGILLLTAGVLLWWSAVFQARIDESIQKNRLVTEGVYAWVRNPVYTAFLMACTGALLLEGNLWLLALPPLYWLFMTRLMKGTEETWLLRQYGEPYAAYCRRVNRCIPWFPKKDRE